MFLEDTTKVMGVVFANIFNTEVIYDDTESERSPFKAPESRNGELFVVSSIVEALGEEVIGNIARLQKAVDVFTYLEVYPPFTRKSVDFIFENKFLWDIR